MPSLNENVADIKKRINALNVKRNKKGIPFKSEANAVKKMSVREWKFTRKKMLNNKLNALNNNFANELEKLLNVEIVEPKKKKKKFPKGTKVEQL
jgi:DNA polymerase/3'-5' exonuclease PolX